MFIWKQFALGIVEFKQRLPLIMELKMILTFMEPAALILVIPLELVEKNLAALKGCQLPKLLFWSVLSASIITVKRIDVECYYYCWLKEYHSNCVRRRERRSVNWGQRENVFELIKLIAVICSIVENNGLVRVIGYVILIQKAVLNIFRTRGLFVICNKSGETGLVGLTFDLPRM